MPNTSPIRPTEFDNITGSHRLQMMKAALPYMEAPQQRALSILIRLQELRRTLNLLEEADALTVGICSLDDSQPRSPMDMLKAIRPYGSPWEQDFIDRISNFLQGMRPEPQRQESDDRGASPASPARPALQQMMPFLSPEQQSRLDTASMLVQAMQQLT